MTSNPPDARKKAKVFLKDIGFDSNSYDWFNSKALDILRLTSYSQKTCLKLQSRLTAFRALAVLCEWIHNFFIAFASLFVLVLMLSGKLSLIDPLIGTLWVILFFCLLKCVKHYCLDRFVSLYKQAQGHVYKDLGVDFIDARIRYKNGMGLIKHNAQESVGYKQKLLLGSEMLFDDKYAIDRLAIMYLGNIKNDSIERRIPSMEEDNQYINDMDYSDEFRLLADSYQEKFKINLYDDEALATNFFLPSMQYTPYHRVIMARFGMSILFVVLSFLAIFLNRYDLGVFAGIAQISSIVTLIVLGAATYMQIDKPYFENKNTLLKKLELSFNTIKTD